MHDTDRWQMNGRPAAGPLGPGPPHRRSAICGAAAAARLLACCAAPLFSLDCPHTPLTRPCAALSPVPAPAPAVECGTWGARPAGADASAACMWSSPSPSTAYSSLTFIIGGTLTAALVALMVAALWWRQRRRGGGCVLWRPGTWGAALADPVLAPASGPPGVLRCKTLP